MQLFVSTLMYEIALGILALMVYVSYEVITYVREIKDTERRHPVHTADRGFGEEGGVCLPPSRVEPQGSREERIR